LDEDYYSRVVEVLTIGARSDKMCGGSPDMCHRASSWTALQAPNGPLDAFRPAGKPDSCPVAADAAANGPGAAEVFQVGAIEGDGLQPQLHVRAG
jgi:hypothetical protein